MSETVTVALTADQAASVAAIARALPDPASLESGTKVVIPGSPAGAGLAARLLSVVGRGRTIHRAHRCTALLARGYERIGAGPDPKTGQDLAFGFAPEPY